MRTWTNGPVMSGDTGAGGGGDVESMLRKIETLRSRIASHREESERIAKSAAEKERIGRIQAEIARRGISGGFSEDALRFFRDETTVGDDGSITSKDGRTLAAFMDHVVNGPKKHWRTSPSQQRAASAGGTAAFDTSIIRPGMTEAEKAAAYSAISAQVTSLTR